MKKLMFWFLLVIASLLFISCDECLATEEIECSGIVYDKQYKSSWVQPIVHHAGKVTTVTYVTHPAQYNVYVYTNAKGMRLEGRINNKNLYNNCSNGDSLTCYYVQKTYLKKKYDYKYWTFSDLKLRYYVDED